MATPDCNGMQATVRYLYEVTVDFPVIRMLNSGIWCTAVFTAYVGVVKTDVWRQRTKATCLQVLSA